MQEKLPSIQSNSFGITGHEILTSIGWVPAEDLAKGVAHGLRMGMPPAHAFRLLDGYGRSPWRKR